MIDPNDLRHAMRLAADWLEANPDKHITGELARTSTCPYSETVSPTDPRATCFCAFGRVMKELDLSDVKDLDPQLNYTRVYDINDGNTAIPNPRAAEELGDPKVIQFLREKADADLQDSRQ